MPLLYAQDLKHLTKGDCMTKIINLVVVVLLANIAFANENDDSSVSERQAQQLALNYSYDNVFQEILDSSSTVKVIASKFDGSRFVFTIVANGNCVVDVLVSSETGMAFTEADMKCKDNSISELESSIRK